MKIELWSIGKSHEGPLAAAIEDFTKRAGRYFKTEWLIITPPRNAGALEEADLKKKEGELVIDRLEKDDFLVALDEHGKQLTSEKLADFLQARANDSTRRLIFLIGGAFGLSQAVLHRANLVLGLSQLTFPHQLVRLLLAEQVYRACTILKNEKYHHR